MKAMHKITDIPISASFVVVLVSQLSHMEIKRFTMDCASYREVVRMYPKVDGNVALVIMPNANDNGDFRLLEMYCQMNLRQVGIFTCPICQAQGVKDACGHLVFERFK